MQGGGTRERAAQSLRPPSTLRLPSRGAGPPRVGVTKPDLAEKKKAARVQRPHDRINVVIGD